MEWCEIFKTGTHTAKKGQVKNWTVPDLDRMVSLFDENKDPAPITIDHEENPNPVVKGPAYGWVEKLKRVGESVFAKFKQVVPAFAKAVDDGLFRTRSIAVNPDGTLRHVSWLGAAKPAIKGMGDFTFSSEDCLSYSEGLDLGTFIFQEDTSVEVEQLKKDLAAAQKLTAEQAGQLTTLTKQNQELSSNFSEAETKRKHQEITAFIDTGIKDSKILPSWKKMGIVEFMAHLEGEAQEYQFSEAETKQNPADWFKKFIMSFSEHSLFSEFARKDKTPAKTDDAAAVNSITKNFVKKEK